MSTELENLTQRLQDADIIVAAHRAALDMLKVGVILIGLKGEVLFANRHALCVLSKEDGLRLGHHVNKKSINFLLAKDAQVQISIDSALSEAISQGISAPPQFYRSVLVPRPSNGIPYTLNFHLLSIDNEISLGSNTPRAIVFLTDYDQALAIDTTLLRSNYGLTEAEIRVAMMLTDGSTYEDMASSLGISVNTLKTQLKKVYAKTGVNNRPKLQRLLHSMSQS